MVTSLIGLKQATTQSFDSEGLRLPLTGVKVGICTVHALKTPTKDGYAALQLNWGTKKSAVTTKGAKKEAPSYLHEVKIAPEDLPNYKIGDQINPTDVLTPGDLVKVTGLTKGKGFQGGVRRWHFKGGPRTHGQSDRERAPGSIGMTTTPGRVFKGKHMAGHMGNAQRTVTNLQVMAITPEGQVFLKGLVPGFKGGLLTITKTGVVKNFAGLPVASPTQPDQAAPVSQPKEEVHA